MARLAIERLDDPRLAWYRGVSDPGLLAAGGLFVAEGRLVVRRLLEGTRFPLESVLVTPAAFEGLRDALEPRLADLPVFVVAKDLLVNLTGFNLHRGCLALGRRLPATAVGALLPPPGRAALLMGVEALANADNVGGVFRNAHAFGASGVLLDGRSCDPLYRKAIRTSMGASLLVPWARAEPWLASLREVQRAGFTVVALTPDPAAVDLRDAVNAPRAASPPRVLVLVGNEGAGLGDQTQSLADVRIRIPMAHSAESLNAATASGIALHHYARYCGLL